MKITTMETKKMTPFKSESEFKKDLINFSNTHRVLISEHSKRISDYFEMSCFNLILKYYENCGYKETCMNLINGKYRFKCSPAGIHTNFSYFEISKEIKGKKYIFNIYHNIAVQSHYDKDVFTTPDITVSKVNSAEITENYYSTSKKFSYIPSKRLVTFCEVKNYTPFPELIINFIGIVNELKPSCIKRRISKMKLKHIAPSIMISGYSSKPTEKIKQSLERRYLINVFDNLFNSVYFSVFSKRNIRNISRLDKQKFFDDYYI